MADREARTTHTHRCMHGGSDGSRQGGRGTTTARHVQTGVATSDGRARRGNGVAGTESPSGAVRAVGIILGLGALIGLLILLAYVILSNTSVFVITSIDAESTEHVSAESIARLAAVPEGTTLLNVSEEQVREGLRKNPWVSDVDVARVFPDRLRITVSERRIGELVVMASGTVVWCLGTDNVWIEPLELSVEEGQTVTDAALAAASRMGVLLVTDVPASVNPQAAHPATDGELAAVSAFRERLSPEFLAQVVSMSAPSAESISCVLGSGVEVSLGSAMGIPTKEAVVSGLLARYPNRITYINVRVPSDPAYRLIDTESVQDGTGATGDVDADIEYDGGDTAYVDDDDAADLV